MSGELRVELMFPSLYVKAVDLKGQEVVKTIKAVKADMLRLADNTKAKKFILTFEGTDKMLVLNKTNAYSIADALGERDAAKWVGRKITLYPTTCMAFGSEVECIRVKGAE